MKIKLQLLIFAIALLAATVAATALTTDKQQYQKGDLVTISSDNLPGNNLVITTQETSFRFLGDVRMTTQFIPRDAGAYTAILEDKSGKELERTAFSVKEETLGGDLSVSTDKDAFTENELVQITVEGRILPEHELRIVSPKDTFVFIGIQQKINFVPKEKGQHAIILLLSGQEIYRKNFLVTAPLKKAEKEQHAINATAPAAAPSIQTANAPKQEATPVLKPKKGHFSTSETPAFDLDFPAQKNLLSVLSTFSKPTATNRLDTGRETIIAIVTNPKGELEDMPAKITKESEGKFTITLTKEREFKPGRYRLNVQLIKDGQAYLQEQDFTWGVLAINTNKSIFLPNEDALIAMAVLDDTGRIACDASVTLSITAPDGTIKTMSTAKGEIKTSDECSFLGVTNLPDYYATYHVSGAGTYTINLSAATKNGLRSISDAFMVQDSVEFDVAREGPTRIYPPVPYSMKFTITANKNYNGKITEKIPLSFGIAPQQGLTVAAAAAEKIISWTVNLKKGDTATLSYEFDAPDTSPEFYLLGALQIGAWAEARQWQIASDAPVAGMILFWNESSIPNGWTCVSCSSGDDFYARFPNGSATYGGTGGSPTHANAASTSYTGASSQVGSRSGSTAADAAHTHTVAATIGEASNLPVYMNLTVIRYNDGTPLLLPKGAIAVFNSTPPSGWTVMTAMNGKFVMGSPASTANLNGGENNHIHAVSGSLTPSALTQRERNTGASAAPPSHTHTFSGTSDSQSNEPPYASVIFAKLTGGNATVPKGLISMFNETPSSANWEIVSGTSGNNFLNSRFINGSSAFSQAAAGGSKTHNHGDTVLMATGNSGTGITTQTGTGLAEQGHTHNVTLSYTPAEQIPPFINVIFASKKKDTTPPNNSITTPLPGNFSGSFSVETSANDTENFIINVNLSVLQPAGRVAGPLAMNLIGGSLLSGFFNATVNTLSLGLADGYYNLSTNATDAEGNTNISRNISIIIDNTKPNASIITPVNVTNVSANSLAIQVELNDTLAGIKFVDIQLRSPSNSGTVQSAALISGTIKQGTWGMSYTTPLTDDLYNVTITTNDTALNKLTANLSTVLVERVQPNASAMLPANGSNFSSPIAINASVNDSLSGVFNVSFRVINSLSATQWLYSARSSGTIAAGFWNSTADVSGVNDGFYNITINATDFAGNQKLANISQVIVDKSKPNASAVTPINNTNTSANFLINASVNDSLSGVFNVSFRVINSLSATQWLYSARSSGTIAAGFWNSTADVSGLNDGQYNITINATDYAGNQNLVNISQLIVDRIKANASIITPYNGSLVSARVLLNASVNDSLSKVFNSSFRLINEFSSTNWIYATIGAGSIAAGYWNATASTLGLADGNYNITINATDFAGNQNLINISGITTNNNAPNTTIILPAASANISGNMLVNASINDSFGTVARVNVTLYNNTGNATGWILMGFGAGTATVGYWNATIDTATLMDGYYNVSVNATDSSGNTNISANVSITIDNTKANVSIVKPVNGTVTTGLININASVNDTLTKVAGVSFRVLNENDDSGWITATKNSGTITAGYWDANFNTVALSNGLHNITIRATDFAGTQKLANISAIDISNIVDNIAPNITIIAPLRNSNVSGSFLVNTSINDTLGIVAFANMTIYNNTGNATGWIMMSLGEGTATAGHWNATIDSATLRDGRYNISVNATDNNENVNRSLNISITIDNTKANASIATPANWSVFAKEVFLINASVNDTLSGVLNATFRLINAETATAWLYASRNSGSITAGYWNSSFNSQDLANGNYNITINATDFAGNQRLINVSTITIDNVAKGAGENELTSLRAQACNREDSLSSAQFQLACAGTYPAACPADALSCNDGTSETIPMSQNDFGGVNISSFNSSIKNCASIRSVRICHEWSISTATTYSSCQIGVDVGGDLSWNTAEVACPTTAANAIACTDVTGLENWKCTNFFGVSSPNAWAHIEGMRSQSGAENNLNINAVYFNVTYEEGAADTTAPNITIALPQTIRYNNSFGVPLNFSASDSVMIDKCWYSVNNGPNVTLPNCANTTFNTTSFENNLIVYARDGAGNENQSSLRKFNATLNTTLSMAEAADPVEIFQPSVLIADYQLYNGSDILGASCVMQVMNKSKRLYYSYPPIDIMENYKGLHYDAVRFDYVDVNQTGYDIELHINKSGDITATNFNVWIVENASAWNSNVTLPALVINGTAYPSIDETNKGIHFSVNESFFTSNISRSSNFTVIWACANCTSDIFYQVAKDTDNFGHSYGSGGKNITWDTFTPEEFEYMAEVQHVFKPHNMMYNVSRSGYIMEHAFSLSGYNATSTDYWWNATCNLANYSTVINTSTLTISQNYAPFPNITSITPSKANFSVESVTVTWAIDSAQKAFGITSSYVNLTYANGTFIAKFQNSPFTIAPSYLASVGFYNLTAFALNNIGSGTNMSNFRVVDGVPPQAAIIAPVNGGNVSGSLLVNASVADFVGALFVNATLYNNTGNATGRIPMSLGAGSNLSGYWNATLDISTPRDGYYNVSVNATDSSGNTNISANVSITIDNTKANASIVVPANGSIFTKTAFLINASANDSPTGVFNATFRLTNSEGTQVTAWLYATRNSGSIFAGYWNSSFDSRSIPDGTYNITINATDYAGNQKLANISQAIMDNTAPNISIVLPAAKANLSGNALIRASINDTATPVIAANATIYNNTGNATGRILMSLGEGTATAGYWNATFNSANLRDGFYNISVNATDSAQLVNVSLNVSITIDNTKANTSGVIPLNNSPVNETLVVSASVNDTLSKVANVSFKFVNDQAETGWHYASLITGTTAAGYWNVSINSRSLLNADYNITINATDYAGNQKIANISRMTVLNLKLGAGENENTLLRAQACKRESASSSSQNFAGACSGSYPADCPSDALSCNDATVEAATVGQNQYGGINITSYNSTIKNCASIKSVRLCYEWYSSDGKTYDATTCKVGTDKGGDFSWATSVVTCPTSTADLLTCTDVTSLEASWSCTDFFGITKPAAWAHIEGMRSQGGPAHSINFDILYFNVTYSEGAPDLTLQDSDITFSNASPAESQNITINATITNQGLAAAGSFTVGFFKGKPEEGNQVSNVSVNTLAGGGSIIVNTSYIASIGPNNIYVQADMNNSVSESNENNNRANNTLHVSGYSFYYGNFTLIIALASAVNTTLKTWDAGNNTGNVYAADADSIIGFASLQALGRTISGTPSTNDFSEADSLLNMTNFTDSINRIYTNNNNIPHTLRTFTVFGNQIANVPATNSTNSTSFLTGILWDKSDDSGNNEFDGTDKEDLVFVTAADIPKQGKYAFYNTELRVPTNLRSYRTPDNKPNLVFYTEII